MNITTILSYECGDITWIHEPQILGKCQHFVEITLRSVFQLHKKYASKAGHKITI